ncbi:DUF4097 family beta strand repeat-containing protein [Leifsonia naganoensis]|uniref:DUF4097 domain-containing protein n=1 Tax=Leifsonia naganoensis TaxID=150025 RepID=A0A853DIS6_9MICO|nr:DUF4097 family beta strand repeat-containing protein [Leifsonia naganoensis]NYK09082.1 hypothetical protein [Leifsonia naganoensis]
MQTFDTPSPVTTVVDVPAGRLRFIAAERTDVRVDIRPVDATKARDVKAAERTTAAFAAGTLTIGTTEPSAAFGPSGSVEVTVQLPAGSSVRATGSAELRGAGSLGDVVVEGSVGPIALDEAETVRLSALDGGIAVGRLTGPAEISTARGDIRIAEARRGDVVVSTQFGDVSVGVPAGTTAVLDAGTPHGRISNALRNTDGSATVRIRATTASGDIDAHTL